MLHITCIAALGPAVFPTVGSFRPSCLPTQQLYHPPLLTPLPCQETQSKLGLHCMPNAFTSSQPCQGFAVSPLLSPPPSDELLFILEGPEFTSW